VGFPLAVRGRIRIPDDLVDSAPGHQETPKPPSGGFFVWSLVGLNAISLGYPYIEASFKRINQLHIPESVDVVLNDIYTTIRLFIVNI